MMRRVVFVIENYYDFRGIITNYILLGLFVVLLYIVEGVGNTFKGKTQVIVGTNFSKDFQSDGRKSGESRSRTKQ